MEWKDVTDAISKYAPAAESLLGAASLIPGAGVATGPAAIAVEAISKIFGTDPTPDALHQAITSDPAAAQKLMQAENDYRIAAMKEETERMKAQLADVQNARQMNVDTTKTTGKRDINLYILAYLYTFGFFASTGIMVWLAMSSKIPENMPQAVVFLLGNLFGCLTAGITAILQYFFGSSAGSDKKTELLAKADAIKE